MSHITKLIISLVIAAIAATLTSLLLSGELIDWRLLIAFFIATAATALIVGNKGDSFDAHAEHAEKDTPR